MDRKLPKKLIGFGLLTWIIPFVSSFPFFSMEKQELLIDVFLFKTIMIVLSMVVGTYFLVNVFKSIKRDFVRVGIITGASWFLINLALDMAILIPMSGMSYKDYFYQIGLRYLVVPIIATAMGYVAKDSAS